MRPETLGPTLGERLTPDDVGAAFGLGSITALEQTARYEGHLFLVVTEQGHFRAPGRLDALITERRPGEAGRCCGGSVAGSGAGESAALSRWDAQEVDAVN
jgi:hypothetical protein